MGSPCGKARSDPPKGDPSGSTLPARDVKSFKFRSRALKSVWRWREGVLGASALWGWGASRRGACTTALSRLCAGVPAAAGGLAVLATESSAPSEFPPGNGCAPEVRGLGPSAEGSDAPMPAVLDEALSPTTRSPTAAVAAAEAAAAAADKALRFAEASLVGVMAGVGGLASTPSSSMMPSSSVSTRDESGPAEQSNVTNQHLELKLAPWIIEDIVTALLQATTFKFGGISNEPDRNNHHPPPKGFDVGRSESRSADQSKPTFEHLCCEANTKTKTFAQRLCPSTSDFGSTKNEPYCESHSGPVQARWQQESRPSEAKAQRQSAT
jgi:hypothetical protein